MIKFLLIISFFLFLSSNTYAAQAPQIREVQGSEFITIVNPVRISSYTKNPILSLQAEYAQIADRDLPATWLVTYDVLKNKKMVSAFSDFNEKQEFGIFLEVSADFADDSGVVYNKTNSWHRANSLFLSGYLQQDRKKMIDKVFTRFRDVFGYYPKSVGAWWIDSYSLQYMKSKYKITGVLGVADQYNLDGYQIWGTPYSTVYYPNKLNSAMPASDNNKIDIVTYRWAARDPVNGYLSPTKNEASLFSIQDYPRNNLDISYYKSLVNLYSAKNEINEFAQITLGLEADYNPETYKGQYSDWMDDIVENQANGKVITTMAEFSDWYRNTYKNSPISIIDTQDPLGKRGRIIWINTNSYRMGILSTENNSKVIDFRIYPINFQGPYYISPNKEFNLSVNLPYVIDTVIDKDTAWDLKVGQISSIGKRGDDIEINFQKGKIVFGSNKISTSNIVVPDWVTNSELVTSSGKADNHTLIPVLAYPVGTEGIVFSDFSINIPFAVKHRVERYSFIIIPILLILALIILLILFKHRKLLLYCFIAVLLGLIFYFSYLYSKKYYISQTEYDALSVLKRLPLGKVLVFDKDCLRCEFVTKHKPAAAAGIKNYVAKYSGKKIILDFQFQTADASQIAKSILRKEDITYIYLPRYEEYIENLPYSPEDLGLKRIYENANAQIWQVL